MYIANHMIRHNGKLYNKGDEVPLKYEEAKELLKHKALTQAGKAAVEKTVKEVDEKSAVETTAKTEADKAAVEKTAKEANKK